MHGAMRAPEAGGCLAVCPPHSRSGQHLCCQSQICCTIAAHLVSQHPEQADAGLKAQGACLQVKHPMTMTEKILARHSGNVKLVPGENIWTDVDKLLTHDVCGPPTFGIFEKEFGEGAQARHSATLLPVETLPGGPIWVLRDLQQRCYILLVAQLIC